MQFTQLRTNFNLEVDIDSKKLRPKAELIFIGMKPSYNLDKKSQIQKKFILEEKRVFVTLEALRGVIEGLQATLTSLENAEKFASTLGVAVPDKQEPTA